ncbi:MAG: cyclic nucleotide-binding domain-containing protein [Anaerolineales bacterium]|jgi:CRP-like cAMP-binding protein
MISPELLRRFSFSAGISPEKIVELAKIGKEISVEAGHYFFREGEKVDNLYLILEGEVAISMEIPDRETKTPVANQLAGEIATKDVVVTSITTGSPFGWAAIIPPNEAFMAAKATHPCNVVAFDTQELNALMAADPELAYQMTLQAAEIIRKRLRDVSIETLAFIA